MSPADIARIPIDNLSELNFAFATLDASGTVSWPMPELEGYLRQLVSLKQRNPDLKIVLSIGGWGADHFSDAALTEASRARFVASALQLLARDHLDGLDIDWEYPGQPGPGNRFRPEDRENFTALLAALRAALDRASDAEGRTGAHRLVLTAAVAGGRAYFEHVDVKAITPLVDWLNVMTYDFRGGDSAVTGHHSELFPSGFERAGADSGDASIAQYRAAGVPSYKLVLGAAFYGKIWEGVSPANDGLGQPFTHFAGDIAYEEIVAKHLANPAFVRRWDTSAKAAWLWNAATRTFISYDDPASVREKAAYAVDHGLAGVMYWEEGQDPAGTLLSVLHDHLQ